MSISNALFALILLVGISLLFLERASPEAPELTQLKEQPPHDLSMPDTALIVQGHTTYGATHEEAVPDQAASDSPKIQSTQEHKTPYEPGISIKESRMSIHVQSQPLQTILREISRKTGIPILSDTGVGNPTVSVDLQDIPIAEALEHLLTQQDTFFFYESQARPPAKLRTVWVYPKGRGNQFAPIPTEETKIEQRLGDPDPKQRIQAVETLIEGNGKGALDAVLKALQDTDDQVRYRALFKAVFSKLILPPDLLQKLAQTDTSASIRQVALAAMLDHPDIDRQNVKVIAEAAVNDPDPGVQTQAVEVLAHLESIERGVDANTLLHEIYANQNADLDRMIIPEEIDIH